MEGPDAEKAKVARWACARSLASSGTQRLMMRGITVVEVVAQVGTLQVRLDWLFDVFSEQDDCGTKR